MDGISKTAAEQETSGESASEGQDGSEGGGEDKGGEEQKDDEAAESDGGRSSGSKGSGSSKASGKASAKGKSSGSATSAPGKPVVTVSRPPEAPKGRTAAQIHAAYVRSMKGNPKLVLTEARVPVGKSGRSTVALQVAQPLKAYEGSPTHQGTGKRPDVQLEMARTFELGRKMRGAGFLAVGAKTQAPWERDEKKDPMKPLKKDSMRSFNRAASAAAGLALMSGPLKVGITQGRGRIQDTELELGLSRDFGKNKDMTMGVRLKGTHAPGNDVPFRLPGSNKSLGMSPWELEGSVGFEKRFR
jgi:hypothetical protein